jgi:hypothetical protein
MRYSPVRHCTAPLAEGFSFDLHVLGAPPAFVLSQDQTLQRNLKSQSRLTVLLVELTKKPANPLIHAIEMSKSNKEPLAVFRRRAPRSVVVLMGVGTTPSRLRNRSDHTRGDVPHFASPLHGHHQPKICLFQRASQARTVLYPTASDIVKCPRYRTTALSPY